MDTRRLKRSAEDLARKHGPKVERGVDSAERFAMKRAKGREDKVAKVAGSVRGLLQKQRGRG